MKVLPRKAEVISIGWRPDFRDSETLPDTKVVRTSFFLTAGFFSVAVAMAMFLGFREYQKVQVEKDLIELQVEVDGMKPEHGVKVAANGKFMSANGRIDEIVAMRGNQIVGSDLLISVGAALSPSMVLSQMKYEKDSIVLEGMLNVGADEASALIDEYMEKLKEADVGQGTLKTYDLMSIQRKGTQMIFKLSISKTK